VSAATFTDDGDAVLVVEDNGPGIPPALGGRVFERFVRGGRDGGRGSGLGLAIVRAVAESHAGSVALESPRGTGGTRIEIRIPLAPVPAPPGAAQMVEGASNGAAGAPVAAHTSTTTGSTIGRRRKRS
jgi:K+-sensing histidine kinase KdpD